MKKASVCIFFLCLFFSCKSFVKNLDNGSFSLVNYSDKEIEFLWIVREGEFYPVAKSISVGKNQKHDIRGLSKGKYDIAIDFKGEYNSFNSKKNKKLCLNIEKGFKTIWTVTDKGKIVCK